MYLLVTTVKDGEIVATNTIGCTNKTDATEKALSLDGPGKIVVIRNNKKVLGVVRNGKVA